jgi:ABC-type multidrug transport system fused ATPase/permease subunit
VPSVVWLGCGIAPTSAWDLALVLLALVPLVAIFIVAGLRLTRARRVATKLDRDFSDDSIQHKVDFAARSEGRMQTASYGERDRIEFAQEKASRVAEVRAVGASALLMVRQERARARQTVSERERDLLLASLGLAVAVLVAVVRLTG